MCSTVQYSRVCCSLSQEMLTAIRECAFVCTDMPLLLVLDSHVAAGAPQGRLVNALWESLGDLLLSSEVEVLHSFIFIQMRRSETHVVLITSSVTSGTSHSH